MESVHSTFEFKTLLHNIHKETRTLMGAVVEAVATMPE